MKDAGGLPRHVPGFLPLLLCLGAQLAGVLPRGTLGALLWAGKSASLPRPPLFRPRRRRPPVRDLTQEGVIAQLVAQGWTPKEAEASVQVTLVMVSTLGVAQLNAIHQNPDLVTLDKLALKWAAHCVVHGARPRTG